MSPQSPEEPAIASLPNLRDLGGRTTRSGARVRTGLAYRSSDLGSLQGADAAAFEQLAVRTVYDLRSEEEQAAVPDQLPAGARYVALDVLRDSPLASTAQIFELLADPPAAEAALGGGRGAAFFLGAYRDFVQLRSARAAYGRLFQELARPEDRPALFHCSTGKDRTGWAAAALLLLLGVPDEAVMEDYLLSAARLGPKVRPLIERFRAHGGDPALLEPIIGVRRVYLETAVAEMQGAYGTIERYFADGLGVDTTAQAELRQAFLTG
jgi:protein-tyrosine phosphatase